MNRTSKKKVAPRKSKKAGRKLGSVPSNKFPAALTHLAKQRFGKLMVISGTIVRPKMNGYPYLLVECTRCGTRSLKYCYSILKLTAGCRSCGHPQRAPKWLVRRANSAKYRCTNKNARAYAHYGGRGIRFNFTSPLAMAMWVESNLGLHPKLELDRIDNDGHYEAGNLRYVFRRYLEAISQEWNDGFTDRSPFLSAITKAERARETISPRSLDRFNVSEAIKEFCCSKCNHSDKRIVKRVEFCPKCGAKTS